MFQIWFDPDLSKTISAPASYNDYPADSFPVKNQNEFAVKTYTEGGANFELVAPGINIKEISYGAGEHSFAVSKDKIFSAYILEGKININGEAMGVNDFFTANSDADLEFTAGENGKIFIIESPEAVPYKTYAERYR
jgi:redox-sensitive bicupin YhaK (pirin superfamily)